MQQCISGLVKIFSREGGTVGSDGDDARMTLLLHVLNRVLKANTKIGRIFLREPVPRPGEKHFEVAFFFGGCKGDKMRSGSALPRQRERLSSKFLIKLRSEFGANRGGQTRFDFTWFGIFDKNE